MQPFSQFNWKKVGAFNPNEIANNETCVNPIGIAGYIPYMVIRTDNFTKPVLEVHSVGDPISTIVLANWKSFQYKNGVFWILNGGQILQNPPTGMFQWKIIAHDEFANQVFYVSDLFQYQTDCKLMVDMSGCSDVFPYLLHSAINEKNFTVPVDSKLWMMAGDLNSSYETDYESIERRSEVDKVKSAKVTKYRHVNIACSSSQADMLAALAVMGDIVITANGAQYRAKYPEVSVEIKKNKTCGTVELKWVESVIYSGGCCGNEAERQPLQVKAYYEGVILNAQNEYIDSFGVHKLLQVGQMAIKDNGGTLSLMLLHPDGVLRHVDNMNKGDIVHMRGHIYHADYTLGFVPAGGGVPHLSKIKVTGQIRVGPNVKLSGFSPNPVQLRITNITTGVITYRSSYALNVGKLMVKADNADSVWIEWLDGNGVQFGDSDAFNIIV